MKAVVFAVLAGLCWGVGELFTKSVLHSGRVGPMTVLLARAVVSLPPALLAYLVAYHGLRSEPGEWWRAGTPLLTRLAVGSALLAGFAGVFFFYLGLASGPISVVKPIAFTVGPAVAVLLAWALLREPMPLSRWTGVALVLAGIVLIAGPWSAGPQGGRP
jgi:uncharacterized membrane protein